ncbi:hypothetical protein ACP4OV_028937 [Aristida adscensionis]
MASAGATAPGAALTMKLLVDSSPQRRRVVFAEAGKDAVDFLVSLLAIPPGTAVRLLGKDAALPGCMANLYGSVERLGDAYVQPGASRDAVLCSTMPPPAAAGPNSRPFPLPEPPAPAAAAPKRFYNCSSTSYAGCRTYVTEARGSRCPNCGSQMATEAKLIGSPPPPEAQDAAAAAARRGFVQGGAATYTVTDDLTISPMSNVSSIALLNACAVRDLGALHERTVQIGYKEGLEILRAALQSKTVLTDVFLGKTKPPASTSNGGNPAAPSNNGRRRESLAWRV